MQAALLFIIIIMLILNLYFRVRDRPHLRDCPHS